MNKLKGKRVLLKTKDGEPIMEVTVKKFEGWVILEADDGYVFREKLDQIQLELILDKEG